MEYEIEKGWDEHPPWWKKAITSVGWLVLSFIVAIGFGTFGIFWGVFGFLSAWFLRSNIHKQKNDIGNWSMVPTIAGVGLFLSSFADERQQLFWHGATGSAAILGSVIFNQIKRAKDLEARLHEEIHYSDFEWYRQQRFQKQQKEFEDWCKKHPNRHYSRFRFTCLFFALLLAGCASKQMVGVGAPEPDPDYSNRIVEVHTLPDGAMIDLNGDVAGISPCHVELKNCYQGNWPSNGYKVQVLRARWLDGTLQTERFPTSAKAPSKVAFIHPNARHLLKEQELKLNN